MPGAAQGAAAGSAGDAAEPGGASRGCPLSRCMHACIQVYMHGEIDLQIDVGACRCVCIWYRPRMPPLTNNNDDDNDDDTDNGNDHVNDNENTNKQTTETN